MKTVTLIRERQVVTTISEVIEVNTKHGTLDEALEIAKDDLGDGSLNVISSSINYGDEYQLDPTEIYSLDGNSSMDIKTTSGLFLWSNQLKQIEEPVKKYSYTRSEYQKIVRSLRRFGNSNFHVTLGDLLHVADDGNATQLVIAFPAMISYALASFDPETM